MKLERPITIIELNEFNKDLLEMAAAQLQLPNIQFLLNANCYHYHSNETLDSGHLEPWVQWVSVHCGIPFSQHGVKHLGGVPSLKDEQIWETLSTRGISTGVWGCMNAARHSAVRNLFFVPDPWVYETPVYPPVLNGVMDLPKYLAKHYRNISFLRTLQGLSRFFVAVLQLRALGIFLGSFAKLPLLISRYRLKNYPYICLYEQFSVKLFCLMKKKYKPDVNFLFLNSLAHLQHHYWHEKNQISKELKYGFEKIDEAIGYLLSEFPDDIFVLHNGLMQRNTSDDEPWILYRQKDPARFFNSIGIFPKVVEQNMTHDGHLLFGTTDEMHDAKKLLDTIVINGHKLFYTEIESGQRPALFYRLDYTSRIDPDACFYVGNTAHRFFDAFDEIVTRTGCHVPAGNIYSREISFRDNMMNHEFNEFLLKYIDANG